MYQTLTKRCGQQNSKDAKKCSYSDNVRTNHPQTIENQPAKVENPNYCRSTYRKRGVRIRDDADLQISEGGEDPTPFPGEESEIVSTYTGSTGPDSADEEFLANAC